MIYNLKLPTKRKQVKRCCLEA
uniref:Uncharacterized protein n=1 Tax=Arundo donax TaxID=35708 RepID=A0A0A9AHQ5_ARUDO